MRCDGNVGILDRQFNNMDGHGAGQLSFTVRDDDGRRTAANRGKNTVFHLNNVLIVAGPSVVTAAIAGNESDGLQSVDNKTVRQRKLRALHI